MAEGQGKERWNHTSMLCALIANCHRDPKHGRGRPFTPDDFNPYSDRKVGGHAIEVNDQTIGILRSAFTGQGPVRVSRPGGDG